MCSCPMNSSRVRGRMRSARGRVAAAAESKSPVWPVTAIRHLAFVAVRPVRRDKSVVPVPRAQSLPSMTVDSGRGGEREGIGREVRPAPDVVEREQRRLAELIDQLHAAKLPAGEREPDAGERGILGLGLERERVDVPAGVELLDPKALRHRPIAGQQHRGGRAERGIDVADRDLSELRVVDPDPRAIPDDELRRVRIVEAESPRSVDQHRAAGLLQELAALVEQSLLEPRRNGVETGKIRVQPLRRAGDHGGAGQREQPRDEEPSDMQHHDDWFRGTIAPFFRRSGPAAPRRVPATAQSAGGGGARTSRLPFDCNGPTTPACSISSSMRAARLYPILSRR